MSEIRRRLLGVKSSPHGDSRAMLQCFKPGLVNSLPERPRSEKIPLNDPYVGTVEEKYIF